MLGIVIHHWHLSPNTFWSMTFAEYWAAMKTANPDLDKEINKESGIVFTDEEKAELAAMKRKFG